MNPRNRRGYTLTELVVAASITLAACLGGATAAKVASDAGQRSRVDAAFVAAVARVDEAAPRGLCETLRALKGAEVCEGQALPQALSAPAWTLPLAEGRAPLSVSAVPSTDHAPLWELRLSVDTIAKTTRTEELTHVVLLAR
jgi:hypothetical protein